MQTFHLEPLAESIKILTQVKKMYSITKGNIFADLGLKNPEELLARSELLSQVKSIILKSKLSPKEISKILDISETKVSMLISGKLSAFTSESLSNVLKQLRKANFSF